MNDRPISAGCVVAWGAWVGALLLLFASWFLPPEPGDDLGRMGLGMCGVAVVAHIRLFFVAQSEHLRNAFDLGRDSAQVVRIPSGPR